MKSITVYDEKYNDVKIEIVYADHALTRDDVKILVLKHYDCDLERAKKVEELLGLYRERLSTVYVTQEQLARFDELDEQIKQKEEELK